jgi:hypothetical protein
MTWLVKQSEEGREMELGEIDAMLKDMGEIRDHVDPLLKLAETEAQRCADMGIGGDEIVWRYAAVLAERVEMLQGLHGRIIAGINGVMRAAIETSPVRDEEGQDISRYDEWMRKYFPDVEEAGE